MSCYSSTYRESRMPSGPIEKPRFSWDEKPNLSELKTLNLVILPERSALLAPTEFVELKHFWRLGGTPEQVSSSLARDARPFGGMPEWGGEPWEIQLARPIEDWVMLTF